MLRATAAALNLATGRRAVPETAGPGMPLTVALGAQLVRADLLAADGHTAEAVTVLDEALRAAEPDGLRRPFLDATPTVRRLLRTYPGLAAARPARPFGHPRRRTSCNPPGGRTAPR
jgi:LuxR family maltose regulon positive regulatory protein